MLFQISDAQELSSSVKFIPGAVNGVTIHKNRKNLVIYGDPENKSKDAELVLITDARRDVVQSCRNLVLRGAKALGPENSKVWLTKVDSFWRHFPQTRFHDYSNQTTKLITAPLNVDRFVRGGEVITWQDIQLKVLETPGYTRGAVSYIADIDDKKYAFTGDLIYGDGKIFDLYSFQDSLGSVAGYHGYGARLGSLISSLELIETQKPDIIVPSRGPVITKPADAIQKVKKRIRAVYKNYLSVSAYRWYNPKGMEELSSAVLGKGTEVDYKPLSSVITKTPPPWHMNLLSSNLVFSGDSTAFLIDCGLTGDYEQILRLTESGRLKKLEGIFITHYHDDHTNFINHLAEKFQCPVYATKELKDILENPSAYQMPCLTTEAIKNLTIVNEGQKMRWKEFMLTFYFFPGQTLYHDAVLIEKEEGESIFYTGDSFTPTGIDDYCLLNRNLLHPGSGYFYCIDLLRKLPQNVLLSNQHVDPLFSFTTKELDHMENVLLKRRILLKDLFPWDDINYGIDDSWSKIYPYGQKAVPGQTIGIKVKIYNHSPKTKTFTIRPNVPEGIDISPTTAAIRIKPLTEGIINYRVHIQPEASEGISLITADVEFDQNNLREWCEALIEIPGK